MPGNAPYPPLPSLLSPEADRVQEVDKDSGLSVKRYLAKPDANPDDIFGAYLFADHREDAPPEPDNSKEQNLWSNLQSHYMGSQGVLEPWQEIFQDLIKQGKYRKFLAPPKVRYLYRMMWVPTHQLEDVFGLSQQDIDTLERIGKLEIHGGVYPGRKYGRVTTSSWTTDPQVLFKIARHWGEYRPQQDVLVILVADLQKTPENFYIQPQGMAALGVPEKYDYQQEVVGFGSGFPLERIVFYQTNTSDTDLDVLEKNVPGDVPQNPWKIFMKAPSRLVSQLPRYIMRVARYSDGPKVVRKFLLGLTDFRDLETVSQGLAFEDQLEKEWIQGFLTPQEWESVFWRCLENVPKWSASTFSELDDKYRLDTIFALCGVSQGDVKRWFRDKEEGVLQSEGKIPALVSLLRNPTSE